MISLAVLVVISQIVNVVVSMYIPSPNMLMRREDDIDTDGENSENDELDSNASAPYQNQEGGGQNADGYDDGETG